ncbi:hypothetical protein [Cupriavidus sp. AU9028]|uniref:hypothetical protein n=1 Tax=Cupriavidus sp. AU9028 TaxID=2871157 RepID=UPI001C97944F|nr:hypothetical protein [Cupriavidus sp. AU9028]MBY4897408.1 hypothetical protein [Cupriavidus sp. AU9028]
MTQTRPGWLHIKRTDSFDPMTGWVGCLESNDVCRMLVVIANEMTRAIAAMPALREGLSSETSYFLRRAPSVNDARADRIPQAAASGGPAARHAVRHDEAARPVRRGACEGIH